MQNTDATPDEVIIPVEDTDSTMSQEDMVKMIMKMVRAKQDAEPLTKRGRARAQQDPMTQKAARKKARKRAARSRRKNRG